MRAIHTLEQRPVNGTLFAGHFKIVDLLVRNEKEQDLCLTNPHSDPQSCIQDQIVDVVVGSVLE